MRVLTLLTVYGCLIAGCYGETAPSVSPNVTAKQRAHASASTGLTFPPGTQFLLYHSDLRGPDDAVSLKISLNKADFEAFLGQPAFASAMWRDTYASITDVPGWSQWQPSKVTKYRFEQFELPKAECLSLLIDDDQDDPKVVYLFWHQT